MVILNMVMKTIKRLMNAFRFSFRYSGAQFIWSKFYPPNKQISPSGPIWLIGIYFALYGIASQRYENRMGVIDHRVNIVIGQLETAGWRKAISNIPRIQKMTCPIRPDIINPISVLHSVFSYTYYYKVDNPLINIVEGFRNKLENITLIDANLSSAELTGANFRNSILRISDFSFAFLESSDFYGADISECNFKNARISGASFYLVTARRANFENVISKNPGFEHAKLAFANFEGAILSDAPFQSADLTGANFKNAHLSGADFSGANLTNANFMGASLKDAKNLSRDQLVGVQTLYEIQGLDEELEKELRIVAPGLFEVPNELKRD